MSAFSFVLVLFEIILVVGVVWAILNEDFFVQLENHLVSRIIAAFRKQQKPQPTPPSVKKAVACTMVTEDDEFARFAPFVA